MCLQSDASTERLLQRVVSPEEGLAAHLLWREEEQRIAVEQAAMWMAQPPASSPPLLDDAMDVDRPARPAEAANAGTARSRLITIPALWGDVTMLTRWQFHWSP